MSRFNKLATSLISIMLVACVLSSCGATGKGISKKEYTEVLEYTSLGGESIVDIKDAMRDWVITVYNPSSQQAIDDSYAPIAKYCTDEFIASMKSNINPYRSGQNQTVKIKSSLIGSGEQASDSSSKLLMTFNVTSTTLAGRAVTMEFVFNGDGKIYKYDIWTQGIKG